MAADFDLVKFGARLREVRKARRLTLSDVSEKTGVTIPTISRVERGDAKDGGSATILALAQWANLPLALFGDRETDWKKIHVPKGATTPDVVELHLRADKNLQPPTADLLVKMFRAAYEQAAIKSRK